MPEIEQYHDKVTVASVTIASSGTVSGALILSGTTIVVFQTPATFTGTAMTFQGSIDQGATFKVINNATEAISYTVAADGCYSLDPAFFVGYDQIKLVSGSTETGVRVIKIKVYPV